MDNKFRFTKRRIEDIEAPKKGRAMYYDTEKPGFCLRVTPTGTKTFLVYRKTNGTPLRVKLGTFPTLTVSQARSAAEDALGQIAKGVNPNQTKKAARSRGVTLEEAFQDYLKAKHNLKPRTVQDYTSLMDYNFKAWKTKPLKEIHKEDVVKLHRKMGERSHARANNAMRLLRALFNFARVEYEDEQGRTLFPENPVDKLSHNKAWYNVKRRRTMIKAYDLPIWFNAVIGLSNDRKTAIADTVRDYLLFILFTGLRRTEATNLQWSDIDMKGKTFTITDTKNHEPHTLPLPEFLYQILARRKLASDSPYIFHGADKDKPLVEPRKVIDRVKEASGVEFTLHDLRRTFTTIANSLDISQYTLKRLINHKFDDKSDVTAGYINDEDERLRDLMERISEAILTKANVNKKTRTMIEKGNFPDRGQVIAMNG